MPALINPIERQNICNRFNDFVIAFFNVGIVWGTNARPFPEASAAYLGFEPFGGTTAGMPIAISASSLAQTPIDAAALRRVLEVEAWRFTRMRYTRLRLYISGSGGNTGSRPVAGTIFDQSQIAHTNGYTYPPQFDPVPGGENSPDPVFSGWRRIPSTGMQTDKVITDEDIEAFMNACYVQWYNYRWVLLDPGPVILCHASCHSSCHSSRGRR